jgi:hypothetical protein
MQELLGKEHREMLSCAQCLYSGKNLMKQTNTAIVEEKVSEFLDNGKFSASAFF